MVLLSGGIDSTACMDYFSYFDVNLHPVFVDYGQPARLAESKSAHAVAQYYGAPLQVMTFAGASIPRFGEISGRNAFLISAALMNLSGQSALISLGIHRGSSYFDCGPRFVQLWDELLAGYTDGRIQLGVPFLRWSKRDIVHFSYERRVPLHLTWSCESSSESPCGRCASCKDREVLNARS